MAPYFTNYWKIWGKCKKCVLHIWHLQLESNLKFYLSSSVLLFWIIVVIIITTTTNIIIRMRECVWTNIYGQIESVLTRQEPLCPNPYTADSFPPEKKWIAYIVLRTYIFINAPVNIEKNIPLLHSLLFKMVYIVLLPFWMTKPLYDRSQPFVKVLLKVWQEDKKTRGEIQSWVTAWNMQANHEC